MRYGKIYFGVVTAALIAAASVPANAAPGVTPALATVADGTAAVEQIHWRSSRHGHWRNGNRWWRHGGDVNRWDRGYRSRYYGYNRGPSFSLRFGGNDWDGRRSRRNYYE